MRTNRLQQFNSNGQPLYDTDANRTMVDLNIKPAHIIMYQAFLTKLPNSKLFRGMPMLSSKHSTLRNSCMRSFNRHNHSMKPRSRRPTSLSVSGT